VDLLPRWGGWLNETRNCPLQVLGMAAMQRALYSPELQQIFPSIVQVFSDQNLKSMEHRHVVQLLKQVRRRFCGISTSNNDTAFTHDF
jgi:hypothetical protein